MQILFFKGKCKENQFNCEHSRECIPLSWKCNGVVDCEQGEDEKDITCSEFLKHFTSKAIFLYFRYVYVMARSRMIVPVTKW